MISTNLQKQDFRDFGSWNANHVRWQLTQNGFSHSPADNGGIPAYEVWLESELKHLDEKECHLFTEKRFQYTFLSLWEKIAQRYKNESIIQGYDLVNEPV